MTARRPLLELHDLSVEFRQRRRPPLRAVDGITVSVAPGETLGIVGESGSGKSTLVRAVLGLVRPSRGRITFDGRDITHATSRERRELSAYLQVVFQDPYGSLNPSRTVQDILTEPALVHRRDSASERRRQVTDMLRRVGLPADAAHRFPTSFSGGQRQRIAIARALMLSPRMVICDEPVSALDLSVQAQILNLLSRFQRDTGTSLLFIAHDLAVVRHMAHRIAVIYRGKIMEEGDAATVYHRPVHPYTRALSAAEPIPDPVRQRQRRLARISPGTSRSAAAGDAHGCPFAPRCPFVLDRCITERPQPLPGPTGSLVACHRRNEPLDHVPALRVRVVHAGGRDTVFAACY